MTRVAWIGVSTACLLGVAGAVVAWQGLASWPGSSSVASRAAPTAQAPRERAAAGAAQGQPRRIGDWSVQCSAPRASGGEGQCLAVQRLVRKEDKRAVFAWLIGEGRRGSTVAVFRTPPGAAVGRGLELTLDGRSRLVPFRGCDTDKCQAILVVSPEVGGAMKTAKAATARYWGVGGRPLTVNLSTDGLGDALALVAK